jgi:hypothetical protein
MALVLLMVETGVPRENHWPYILMKQLDTVLSIYYEQNIYPHHFYILYEKFSYPSRGGEGATYVISAYHH